MKRRQSQHDQQQEEETTQRFGLNLEQFSDECELFRFGVGIG
jgi:hypothetical protein